MPESGLYCRLVTRSCRSASRSPRCCRLAFTDENVCCTWLQVSLAEPETLFVGRCVARLVYRSMSKYCSQTRNWSASRLRRCAQLPDILCRRHVCSKLLSGSRNPVSENVRFVRVSALGSRTYGARGDLAVVLGLVVSRLRGWTGSEKIRRASGPTACQTCASTGTKSAASRSEEEARGRVYRAVEARDS